MIAKLRGIVDSIGDTFCIIDVGGVGYKAHSSQKTLAQLVKGDPCKLYIETIVREDSITLYGFKDAEEKEWFNLLTTVQGVGARVGLSILSVCDAEELISAILSKDKAYISRAEGVGPKLADRIINELKNKVSGFAFNLGNLSKSPTPLSPNSNVEDAISALTNLGYKKMEAMHAIHTIAKDQDNATVNSLIREGLKALSRHL